MSTLVIDAFDFCRLGERREGDIPVTGLPRLAKETVDGSGSMHWTLEGGRNQHGHPQLQMTVRGEVRLICQRCLQPFAFPIDSDAVLVLAQSEGSADEIEALLDDEDVEVIVGSRSQNIAELVEDDALLALPLSPRHDTCPDQLLAPLQQAAQPEQKESPFAVLKNLKR